MNINTLTILGNISNTPQVRKSKTSSNDFVSFTIACGNKNSSDTFFLDCLAFGQTAMYLAKYAERGTRVVLVGNLKGNSYTNKEGKKISNITLMVSQTTTLRSGRTISETEQEELKEISDTSTTTLDDDDLPF